MLLNLKKKKKEKGHNFIPIFCLQKIYERKIMKDKITEFRDPQKQAHDDAVLELQRLLTCYQIASTDDKKVVWAALNKYAKHISI